jgi:hypothetical protein
MSAKTAPKKAHSRDVLVIISTVAFVVAMLLAFEQMTGLPASIRGTEVYNTLPMPSVKMKNTGEESRIPTVSSLTKERLCERVVKQFGWHSDIWERVNERILERLGFKCRL